MHSRQRQLCHDFLCKTKPVLDMSKMGVFLFENAAKVGNETQRNTMWFGFVRLPAGELATLSVESVISGSTLENLIVRPSGSGEINMIQMTLPVIATVYLDKTDQWEMIGFVERNKALGHIQTGGWEFVTQVQQFCRVTAGVSCVQATVINLPTVKVMDPFLCHRINRAAPGSTPTPAVLFSCTCAAC